VSAYNPLNGNNNFLQVFRIGKVVVLHGVNQMPGLCRFGIHHSKSFGPVLSLFIVSMKVVTASTKQQPS
jgi:hypothetical protein